MIKEILYSVLSLIVVGIYLGLLLILTGVYYGSEFVYTHLGALLIKLKDKQWLIRKIETIGKTK